MMRRLTMCLATSAALSAGAKGLSDELPIVDLSRDASIQTVIAFGADGVYQGHPTTVVAPDGTIYCVWTINHGGKCGPMAKSTDGGKSWTRCDKIMPENYGKSHCNCPTLQTIIRPDGGTNLVVFSAKKGGCGIVISPDGGKSWWEAPTANLSAGKLRCLCQDTGLPYSAERQFDTLILWISHIVSSPQPKCSIIRGVKKKGRKAIAIMTAAIIGGMAPK